jgi:hypothetical protein
VEAEVRTQPVAVAGEAAGADMGKPELAHIAVEVAAVAPDAGNQREQQRLLLLPE